MSLLQCFSYPCEFCCLVSEWSDSFTNFLGVTVPLVVLSDSSKTKQPTFTLTALPHLVTLWSVKSFKWLSAQHWVYLNKVMWFSMNRFELKGAESVKSHLISSVIQLMRDHHCPQSLLLFSGYWWTGKNIQSVPVTVLYMMLSQHPGSHSRSSTIKLSTFLHQHPDHPILIKGQKTNRHQVNKKTSDDMTIEMMGDKQQTQQTTFRSWL